MLTQTETQQRLNDYSQGFTDKELGKMWFLSPDAVKSWRHKYNLPANGRERNETNL
jgi:uncharacterized protein YjcR